MSALPTDTPPPLISADAVLYIAIACYTAGRLDGLGTPASDHPELPSGVWIRLARLAWDAETLRDPEPATAPAWLRKLYPTDD